MLRDVGTASGYGSDDDEGEDGSLRALARIRLEDLQAEDCIRELAEGFKEFSQKKWDVEESGEKSECDVELNVGLPGGVEEGAPGSFDIEASFAKQLLRFLGRFFTEFLSPDAVVEPGVQFYTSRERRKRRILLEALKAFLQKLLERRVISFRYMLERQIKELRKAIKAEADPRVLEILQERLELLLQLKAQILQASSGVPNQLLIFRVLTACALAAAILEHRYGPFRQGWGLGMRSIMGGMWNFGRPIPEAAREHIGRISSSFSPQYSTHQQCTIGEGLHIEPTRGKKEELGHPAKETATAPVFLPIQGHLSAVEQVRAAEGFIQRLVATGLGLIRAGIEKIVDGVAGLLGFVNRESPVREPARTSVHRSVLQMQPGNTQRTVELSPSMRGTPSTQQNTSPILDPVCTYSYVAREMRFSSSVTTCSISNDGRVVSSQLADITITSFSISTEQGSGRSCQ